MAKRYTVTAKIGNKVVERIETDFYNAAAAAFDRLEFTRPKATTTLVDNRPFVF